MNLLTRKDTEARGLKESVCRAFAGPKGPALPVFFCVPKALILDGSQYRAPLMVRLRPEFMDDPGLSGRAPRKAGERAADVLLPEREGRR